MHFNENGVNSIALLEMELVKRKSTVNPNLERERQNCSFDTSEFTNWWYDGAAAVERRRKIGIYSIN